MGAKPPIQFFFCNNVVVTPKSWHGRVLFLPSSPVKPPFGLLSPISSIIVRDRHDKTLRIFFYFSDRLSLAISVVVLIFSIFRLNMAVFAFLRYVMSQFVFF